MEILEGSLESKPIISGTVEEFLMQSQKDITNGELLCSGITIEEDGRERDFVGTIYESEYLAAKSLLIYVNTNAYQTTISEANRYFSAITGGALRIGSVYHDFEACLYWLREKSQTSAVMYLKAQIEGHFDKLGITELIWRTYNKEMGRDMCIEDFIEHKEVELT